MRLAAGDALEITTPGSGGYDVIDPETHNVDAQATRRLREERSGKAVSV
jgi:N-methylhydantoinase B/oxoprolinase/acetone carboxylase alpha subunit